MTKRFIIDFKLKELSASHYWHSVEVEATNLGRAIDKGWQTIRKRPAVKGKRISEAQISAKEIK